MDIGERLFSLRAKTGETLQEVADKVGVSKAHVWELEKGRSKNPSFELVRKLAKHFGVTVEVLIGEADEPDQKQIEIARIYRGLEDLSDRDRAIVEQMIETMRFKKVADG
ncbi:DNA-binding XRE family transcriptional regulator [Litoreibacter ponti]|uniref:DNA-binding XRE family transcriptional regulator n=1 Tax=Litoreibacter ponti TaxID=1510457 RepID=A0A2T6BMU8_9RHOB|nr:helix-turn-helix transcriptional regulator [Litoreibacter ponti]PTX57403.1 DNA-binding XRE family transcriptional regulator [Litoreibacter ponti]